MHRTVAGAHARKLDAISVEIFDALPSTADLFAEVGEFVPKGVDLQGYWPFAGFVTHEDFDIHRLAVGGAGKDGLIAGQFTVGGRSRTELVDIGLISACGTR